MKRKSYIKPIAIGVFSLPFLFIVLVLIETSVCDKAAEWVKGGNVEAVASFLRVMPSKLNESYTWEDDSEEETMLHMATRNKQERMVRYLVIRGADVNAKSSNDETPLSLAIEWGNYDVIKLLLERRADSNLEAFYGKPLQLAVWDGQRRIADLLRTHGAKGVYPIHFAAGTGDVKGVIEELKRDHSLVKVCDKRGNTPLHLATHNGYLAVVRELVRAGADINAADNQKHTPLHEAAGFGNEATCKYLLDNGADVDARDWMRETPLYSAIMRDRIAAMRVLITAGADVNAKDKWGTTPLYMAVVRKSESMVRMLVAKGADVNARDDDGETPLSRAKEDGLSEILKVFRDSQKCRTVTN